MDRAGDRRRLRLRNQRVEEAPAGVGAREARGKAAVSRLRLPQDDRQVVLGNGHELRRRSCHKGSAPATTIFDPGTFAFRMTGSYTIAQIKAFFGMK
jgi:hypothetical protein